jgi:DNA-binding transcriptional regulator YbjK
VASERGESLTLRERAIRVLGEELNRPQEVRALYARLAEPALRERALRVAVEQGGTAELAWVREVAEDPGEGGGVRDRAIRLLAERGEMAHLRALYPKLDRLDLRERVIRSVAERHDAEAAAWLADIVLDDREQSALRDRAVRSLADAGTPSAELAALYDRVGSSAVKQRLIRVLADRRDDAAARKLAAIAAGDPDAALRREAERRRR